MTRTVPKTIRRPARPRCSARGRRQPLLERLESRRVLDSTVVFNELMYNPVGAGQQTNQGTEWIEVHNLLSVEMDVSKWRIAGGVDFEFPAKSRIPPDGFVVIAADPAAITAADGVPVLGPFSGQLGNGGDTVQLLNANRRVMDQMNYDDRGDWPVGPDGSGATLAKRDPQAGSQRADNWVTSLTIGGSPGADNGAVHTAEPRGLELYELPAGGSREFWVELYNPTNNPVAVSDYTLLVDGSINRGLALPAVTLDPGQWLAVDHNQLQVTLASRDRLFLIDTASNSVVDAIRVEDRPIGRSPAQSNQWWFPSRATPGQANEFVFDTRVVINEIMYHAAPLYETAEQPFAESDLEWVELYNRADSAVDLSGWRVDGGIDFQFAPGSQLAPGQYALLVGDRAEMLAEFPELGNAIVGEFTGRLSNDGERLALLDAAGNPADRVHYYDGGRWPEMADGGGSSLELIDPDADNSQPEPWAASREADKSQWQSFSYRMTAREPGGTSNPRGYNELILGLLDAGEVLIDDLRVIEDPDNAAISHLQNGSFDQDPLGASPGKWRVVGNHDRSRVVADPEDPTNHVLRLIATGATEHMSNHAETTFVGDVALARNAEVEISFRARWLSGSPRLNTRLYFNQAGETSILPTPRRAGTPAAPNSTRVDNAGPTYDHFLHQPLIPDADQPVTVTARAQDPDGVQGMTLWYSVNGGSFQSQPMTADGQGTFSAQIPGQRSGRTVQFYVETTDSLGATSNFPAAGPDSRAVYRVGSRAAPDDVQTLRLVMTPGDVSFMHTPTHVMSNDRLGSTVVFGDQVFYDVGVRLRNSGYGRNDARTGFNIQFHPDQLFRGEHSSVAVDRGVVLSPGTGQGPVQGIPGASPHELLIHHIANHAGGLAGMYDDVIYFDSPRSTNAGLGLLKMARYGNAYLDSQFQSGSDGSLFEFELIYYYNRATATDPEALKGSPNAVLGTDIRDLGDDADAYRWNYILKNNRDRDDFSRIIQLAQSLMLRSDQLQEAADQVMDVEAWMRYQAFQSLVGTADTFNMGLAHNIYLYVRPEDQRVLPMPWDVDHGFFYNPSGTLLGQGGTRFSRLVNLPQNERLVYKHLLDIVQTTYNLDYLQPWIDHYTALTRQDLGTFFSNYIDARSRFVAERVQAVVPRVGFAITTNGGQDFSTDAATVTLAGNGWVDVDEVRTTSGDVLPVRWTGETTWELPLPIGAGVNAIELAAFDMQGRQVGQASIQVTGLGLPGDFDGNGQIDAADIDALCAGIDTPAPRFDLNADGRVDKDDLDHMIHQILGTSYGDADLNGRFDSSDLVSVFAWGQYEDETDGNSGWLQGDWNCDGDFDSSDLVEALADGGFVA
jgi:hypothetical protein